MRAFVDLREGLGKLTDELLITDDRKVVGVDPGRNLQANTHALLQKSRCVIVIFRRALGPPGVDRHAEGVDLAALIGQLAHVPLDAEQLLPVRVCFKALVISVENRGFWHGRTRLAGARYVPVDQADELDALAESVSSRAISRTMVPPMDQPIRRYGPDGCCSSSALT